MADPNRALFESVVRLLAPVLDELVFVGGCTTGLFITDSAAGGIRPTRDVDAIVDVASYSKYTALAERLRERVGDYPADALISRPELDRLRTSHIAELLRQEKPAHPVLHQIAIDLRREMRTRILQPVEHGQPLVAGERFQQFGLLHFVSLPSY